MTSDLSPEFVQRLKSEGLTYDEMGSYGVSPRKFRRMRNKLNLPITQEKVGDNGKKRFYLDSNYNASHLTVNHSEERRLTSATKQTITQKANEYLAQLEQELKNYREAVGGHEPSHEMQFASGNEDIVLHRGDDHFGEVVKDNQGNIIFNTEIATERLEQILQHSMDAVDAREEMGHSFENAHLLLGGDHVTNEAIYSGQAFDIEQTIDEQITAATSIYNHYIETLSERFDSVQVVCQAGNHGEFRVDGASSGANADRFLYDRLELAAHHAGLDNVRFIKSDRADNVNFQMRNHVGHLRHGHNYGKVHIGTASALRDWRGYMLEHEFDIAYRGHFHEHRVEYVNGAPVIMTPSIKPPGEFESQNAIIGSPMAYIHGVSDDNPYNWSEQLTF